MAFAVDTYTGNGSTTTFSVTFPYIEQAHVIVTVDGVTKTLTTDYTFPTSSTITFTSAPAASTIIKFTRSSNRTDTAKSTSSFPTQASKENNKFVEAIAMPEINNARIIPPFITKKLPNSVNRTVVIQPTLFEYTAISDFEKPISL